jgi:predicted ATP-dependent endonuclease of OLD family
MKKFGKIIREIIPVIIGILVALAVNNWNENRKDKEYLNQIYASIDKELEESRKDILIKIPKQQKLIDSLGKYLNDETITLYEIIQKANGIHGPQIKNYSWKAIANSKIELIDFEKLSELSEIDESKEGLDLKMESLIGFLNANLKTTDQEKKRGFHVIMRRYS